ncbi:fibrinogen-like protein A [Anopheles cruzii]|uniref:fibrinogen-like protein A n=1 Tax=Anopheles cruzii TaxID=68878 RepID=UPI0022EC422D|nr:fibrinogen-like protein A [Anopheles cruzii]
MLMAKLDYMQHSVLELQTELAKQREEAAQSQADTKAHMTMRLDQMQHNFLELQTEVAKHREEAAQSQNDSEPHMQHCFLELQTELTKHREEAAQNQKDILDDFGRNFTLLQERSWQILTQILTRVTTKTNPLSYAPYPSCSDIRNAQSGAYIIQTNGASNPFMAYCQRDMMGKGIWLVIQIRFDGSLDFYRNWTEYRNGFGDIEKEFWIGLERIHQLTSGRPHELMVELRDFKGNYKFALYAAFEIGSEAEHYNLKTLGAYNGTAGDSLSYHKNMKFSTYDRDNDVWTGVNCAAYHEGAWWYDNCSHSNLNGPYKNKADHRSMHWQHFSGSYEGLSFSRMMIRPK